MAEPTIITPTVVEPNEEPTEPTTPTAVAEEPTTPDSEAPVAEPETPAEEPAAEVEAPTPEPETEPEMPAEPEAPAPEAPIAPELEAPKPVQPVAAKTAKSGGKGHMILEIVMALIIVGLGFYAYNLSSQKKDLQTEVAKLNSNPQIVAQRTSDTVIKKVGAITELPSGETPTVASVSDSTKAKTQSAFFAKSENGDKVLMYPKAGKAILYRPSTDKIILIAPLTFNNGTSKTQ